MSKESIRQYLVALSVTLTIFGSLSLYLFARRGYFDLSIVNKSFASTSALLLALVLLLGPLSRFYNRFDKWINYRKELGILALFTSVAHVYIVMFPLAYGGPLDLFKAMPLAAYPGLIALLIMVFLFALSFEKVKARLELSRWWKFQYTGARLAGLAVLMHLSVLKAPGWIRWITYQEDLSNLANPRLLPASMLVGFFSLFVLLVRLSELFGARFARIFTPVCLALIASYTAYLFAR